MGPLVLWSLHIFLMPVCFSLGTLVSSYNPELSTCGELVSTFPSPSECGRVGVALWW